MPSQAPRASSRSPLLRVLLVFALVGGLALVISLALLVALGSGGGVKKGSVLVVDFSAPLTEAGGAPTPLAALMGGAPHPLPAHEAASALRAAKDDDRISAVLLRGGFQGGIGALDQVRDAVLALTAAGKPTFAAPGSADERTLWMCSAAREIWLEPLGGVEFDGWVAEIPYFADALQRVGIEVQVTRVGKYKSAVEPFLLERMSAENREQLDAILAAIESKVLGDIASARGLDVANLRAWTREEGWFTAKRALEAGLVTHTGSQSDLIASLRRSAGIEAGEPLPQVDLVDYARDMRTEPGGGAGIVVLVAEGEIVDGSSIDGIGADDLARELRAAREDDDVHAVVLRVDSPGGSATASDVIRAEVLALKAAGKPVVVSMGTLAASGGYWISADADAIVAQPETLTGSIGVFGMLPNAQALAESHGVRTEQVRTSPLSGIGSMLVAKDEAQMALVQAIVDDVYERFLDLVAAGRGMERDTVHAIAQGRVWSGAKAQELGLVDELGGLARAIEIGLERAGLPADAPVRFAREEPEWFEEVLVEMLREEPGDLTRMVAQTRRALGPLVEAGVLLERFERLAGPRRVVARLPFNFVLR